MVGRIGFPHFLRTSVVSRNEARSGRSDTALSPLPRPADPTILSTVSRSYNKTIC